MSERLVFILSPVQDRGPRSRLGQVQLPDSIAPWYFLHLLLTQSTPKNEAGAYITQPDLAQVAVSPFPSSCSPAVGCRVHKPAICQFFLNGSWHRNPRRDARIGFLHPTIFELPDHGDARESKALALYTFQHRELRNLHHGETAGEIGVLENTERGSSLDPSTSARTKHPRDGTPPF